MKTPKASGPTCYWRPAFTLTPPILSVGVLSLFVTSIWQKKTRGGFCIHAWKCLSNPQCLSCCCQRNPLRIQFGQLKKKICWGGVFCLFVRLFCFLLSFHLLSLLFLCSTYQILQISEPQGNLTMFILYAKTVRKCWTAYSSSHVFTFDIL